MQRTFSLMLLLALLPILTMAQQGYPKKHLLEHFTGEACGYCPGGYDSIYQFTEEHPNVIWVSHHKGFRDDAYTITESSSIATINEVSGTPSCAINRSAAATLPANLFSSTELSKTTSFASVNITHSYDAATRLLSVTVSGDVRSSSYSYIKLSVCLTESGMISKQADYNRLGTVQKWNQYRHVHVPRMFLSAALGDKLSLNSGKYTKTFSTALDTAWDADNMSIVAYITGTSDKPVINAATTPIVSGTNGADHSKPEGLDDMPTSIEENSINELAPRKFLHNGVLRLYVGQHIYDLTGRMIQ